MFSLISVKVYSANTEQCALYREVKSKLAVICVGWIDVVMG